MTKKQTVMRLYGKALRREAQKRILFLCSKTFAPYVNVQERGLVHTLVPALGRGNGQTAKVI